MDLSQELIEKEFLSILMFKTSMAIDLLQIKPQYLANKDNIRIMEVMLKAYKKFGVIDIANILSLDKNIYSGYLFDILDDENVPILDIRKQFMSSQKIILDNYKKRVISDLTFKLSKNKITTDEYLNNMSKVNEIVIKDEINLLTIEELNNNINTENVGIVLNSFPKLNETLKLVENDFFMIGASTGVGKSGLLLNFMNDLMDKYQCIYFNMEMSKSTIYQRMISIKSGVPLSNINNPLSPYQEQVIKKAMKNIVDSKVIVEHKATYIHEIKAVLSKCKDDSRHTIIFLDHVGLIKSLNNKSLYEQTTEVVKQLRQFCLDYDCTIISACQLNRASYNSLELNLSMLKDSGELENSSSKIILLYKNKENESKEKYVDNMVLDIVKNRDGIKGKIAYTYDKTKQIFKEV